MDYTELYDAILKGEDSKVTELMEQLIPALTGFLRASMRASEDDSKDCIQQALLLTIEKIRDDKIRDPSKLKFYLLTACRNIYLRMIKHINISLDETNPYHTVEPANQLKTLLDKEKKQILSQCLDELSPAYYEFISYWFENPDSDASAVAQYFDISLNNAWTRKHRIIKMLNECIETRINK